jgi:hypothetical protein
LLTFNLTYGVTWLPCGRAAKPQRHGVSELLSGGNGRIVIGADQGLKALDMAIAVDVLPAVIAHSRNLPPERQPVHSK